MPAKGKITAAERRHRDYLRRKTLRVASVYETRLAKDRRAELRRVLALAKDYNDPIAIVPLLQGEIDETGYLGKWWRGLVVDVGLPIAKATASDLRAMKAAGEEDVWLTGLRNYATARAGNEIVVVSGTWKDSLVRLARGIMEQDLGLGIEKLTKRIYERYVGDLERWQVRRIAQTEAMIGMAEAANEAAKTLSIHYTKEWVISGLGNTRPSHEAMDGVTVDEDEPFVLPGGMMLYPHDTSMGADAGEIINCACDCIRRPKNETPAPPAQQEQIQMTEKDRRIAKFMEEMDPSYSEEVKLAKAKNYLQLEKKLKIKKIAPMTIEGADKQSANPFYSLNRGYQTNCATCANAYVLREQGFNVTAKPRLHNGSLNDQLADGGAQFFHIWKDAKGKKVKPAYYDTWAGQKKYTEMSSSRFMEFFEESCKEKGTYIADIAWSRGGGHAFVIKRLDDGKLVYIEPQRYLESEGAMRSLNHICNSANTDLIHQYSCGVLRVDDKVFDPKWAGLFDTK